MQIVPLPDGPDMAASLAQHLDRFLARLPPSVGQDRREMTRVAIPLLLRITPIEGGDDADDGPPLTAVGKDLSRGGIGLFHRDPLPHRHVVLTFDDARLEGLSVEVELNRCRFSNLGWYESGGRLLRLAQPRYRASLAG